MIDDYIINYIINEARRLAVSQNSVLHKRQCNLYLSADRVERLRRLLNEKMPGMSLSGFIDLLVDVAIKALEENQPHNPEAKPSEPKLKCHFASCNEWAVGFAINRDTGRRYPVCRRHYELCAQHEKWTVE